METRILLVDDDHDFLEIMVGRLRELQFGHIVSKDDPTRAAALIENGSQFDLALLDMTMPNMTGLELLDIIKRSSPLTECIIITAVDEARAAVTCLQKGAYDYLIKPVSKEDMALSIHRALEHKRLLDLRDIGKQQVVPRLKNREAFKEINTISNRMIRVLKEAELMRPATFPYSSPVKAVRERSYLPEPFTRPVPEKPTPLQPSTWPLSMERCSMPSSLGIREAHIRERKLTGQDTWSIPTRGPFLWMKSGFFPWKFRESFSGFCRMDDTSSWEPVPINTQMFDLLPPPTPTWKTA